MQPVKSIKKYTQFIGESSLDNEKFKSELEDIIDVELDDNYNQFSSSVYVYYSNDKVKHQHNLSEYVFIVNIRQKFVEDTELYSMVKDYLRSSSLVHTMKYDSHTKRNIIKDNITNINDSLVDRLSKKYDLKISKGIKDDQDFIDINNLYNDTYDASRSYAEVWFTVYSDKMINESNDSNTLSFNDIVEMIELEYETQDIFDATICGVQYGYGDFEIELTVNYDSLSKDDILYRTLTEMSDIYENDVPATIVKKELNDKRLELQNLVIRLTRELLSKVSKKINVKFDIWHIAIRRAPDFTKSSFILTGDFDIVN